MIDRLYEINRVLVAARVLSGAGPAAPIPLDSIIRVCRDSALDGRMPDHGRTIEYVAALGMLIIDGNEARLPSEALDFLSLNPENYFELTEEQVKVLARKHYLGGTFAGQCREVLKKFSWSDESQRLVWSEFDDSGLGTSYWLVDHLCQLRVLVRTSTGFESAEDATQAVANFVEEPKGLTEEKLRQMILEKEAVGDIGEELVMVYERERLRVAHRVVEAHCVRRVSRIRVNAGYDIESFDDEASTGVFDRFIEVKAARGKDLRFFWTENEMKVAEQLRDRYWIYFLGGIDASGRTSSMRPLLFQDPMQSIMNNTEITRSAQGLLVQGKLRGEAV